MSEAEEKKVMHTAANVYVIALIEANNARKASEQAARLVEKTRADAERAKEALIKAAPMGRFRVMRTIQMEGGQTLVLRYVSQEGDSKRDYVTVDLCDDEGEVK